MTSMIATLCLPKGGVLSLVGAGGKTTAMYRLAMELGAQGLRVCCTTTTKIFPPKIHQARLILLEGNPHLLDSLDFSSPLPVCLAWKRTDQDKLLGLTPALIHQILDSCQCDWLLVEADGSRQLPLKAPASHEPVIPECSTHVLGLIGLAAIGTPLDEHHVCRSEQYAQITGLAPGALVTPASVAALCLHPDGLFKNAPQSARRWIWLNQAENAEYRARGQEVLTILRSRQHGIDGLVLGALEHPECVLEVWTP